MLLKSHALLIEYVLMFYLFHLCCQFVSLPLFLLICLFYLFSQYTTFQSLTCLYFSDLLSFFSLLFQNVGRMNSNLKFHLIYCCFYCFCYFCYSSLNILSCNIILWEDGISLLELLLLLNFLMLYFV